MDAGRMAVLTARVNHNPTEAQKEAGNYRKAHINFQGLPITIENRKGSIKRGIDGTGKSWSCRLPADYGYIKRTECADGDHVDVYIGPDANSKQVFIVNQVDHKSGKFDEHKVLLGFNSERAARDAYAAAFSDGRGLDRMGGMEVVSLDAFKNWLKAGNTVKPAAASKIIDHALRLVRNPVSIRG